MLILLAAYRDIDRVQGAVEELTEDNRVEPERISVIYNEDDHPDPDRINDEVDRVIASETGNVEADEGAALGGLTGALVGLTFGTVTVPGLGPVVAAGAMASGLLGGAAGAATGGLTAALVDVGLDQPEAETFFEVLEGGGLLLGVQIPEEEEEYTTAVLRKYGPILVSELHDINWPNVWDEDEEGPLTPL